MIPWRLIGYGVALLALIAALWAYGHQRYAAGRSDERALWNPALVAAQQAAAEANAKTATIESAQKAATSAAEARHAETIAALNTRAADADRRIRALSLRIATSRSSGCEVPAVSPATSKPDAGTAGAERVERAGSSIADIGRRCEADAATLRQLQQWIAEQSTLSQ